MTNPANGDTIDPRVKEQIEQRFESLGQDAVNAALEAFKAPSQIPMLLLRLGLSEEKNPMAQLQILQQFAEECGPEKFVMKVRYETWRLMQGETGASQTESALTNLMSKLKRRDGSSTTTGTETGEPQRRPTETAIESLEETLSSLNIKDLEDTHS